jgi:hypothetical protein
VRETGLWVVGGRGVLWFLGMKLEIELMETRFLARRLVRWILACCYGSRILHICPFSGRRISSREAVGFKQR